MAFDAENHAIDPVTGYHIDKRTGHRVGIDPAPVKRVSDDTDYPKWVVPHPGHVSFHALHGHVSTPTFMQHHVNRIGGEVTVLVHDAEEEARALAPPHEHPEAA